MDQEQKLVRTARPTEYICSCDLLAEYICSCDLLAFNNNITGSGTTYGPGFNINAAQHVACAATQHVHGIAAAHCCTLQQMQL